MVEPDKIAERLAVEVAKQPQRARDLIERAIRQALNDELSHWQSITAGFPQLMGVSQQIDVRRRALV